MLAKYVVKNTSRWKHKNHQKMYFGYSIFFWNFDTSIVHTNIYSHKKVEMRTQTRKIIRKWSIWGSCGLKDGTHEFCLLVHINLKFVIFVWIFQMWVWIPTFAREYILLRTKDVPSFKNFWSTKIRFFNWFPCLYLAGDFHPTYLYVIEQVFLSTHASKQFNILHVTWDSLLPTTILS